MKPGREQEQDQEADRRVGWRKRQRSLVKANPACIWVSLINVISADSHDSRAIIGEGTNPAHTTDLALVTLLTTNGVLSKVPEHQGSQ